VYQFVGYEIIQRFIIQLYFHPVTIYWLSSIALLKVCHNNRYLKYSVWYISMSAELRELFIKELLDALDDIQRDVPEILDFYLEDNSTDPDSSLDLDIDLLAMNLLNLRDSVNITRQQIELKRQLEQESPTIMLDLSPGIRSTALAMFFHIHMLTDPDSIYNSGIINNWSDSL
jgi:hypothetical protein